MNQLPAHLQHRQNRNLAAQAVGGISAGSPAHISIAGNRFTLVDEAGNQKPVQTLYLDVCVIDANAAVSKIYFDPRTPFEPGGDNSNPPICWSDNGVGASAQASQPQNASCQLCPQNAWGSATSKATGKPVKACNDVKKVAVIVPGIDMAFLLRRPRPTRHSSGCRRRPRHPTPACRRRWTRRSGCPHEDVQPEAGHLPEARADGAGRLALVVRTVLLYDRFVAPSGPRAAGAGGGRGAQAPGPPRERDRPEKGLPHPDVALQSRPTASHRETVP